MGVAGGWLANGLGERGQQMSQGRDGGGEGGGGGGGR